MRQILTWNLHPELKLAIHIRSKYYINKLAIFQKAKTKFLPEKNGQ